MALKGRTMNLVTCVLVVAALSLAKGVLVPIFLAGFLAFLLAPLTQFLQERGHLPNVAAVLVAVLMGTVAIGSVTYIVAIELVDVAAKFPDYKENLARKVGFVQGVQRKIEDVTSEIEQMKAQVTGEADEAASDEEQAKGTDASSKKSTPTGKPARPPVAVQVVQPSRPKLFVFAEDYLSPIGRFLGALALVLVLVPFILLARRSLRDRLVRLLRTDNVFLTARAVDEATERVSQYLVANVMVNVSFGIPVGIGLHLLGLPNAFLWGLTATLLRFVPYLGPWLAAAMPVALAIAVFPGWGEVGAVLALLVGLELISNNVVEPWLYGRTTGLSTLAVLLSALFWSWLWGVAGLFLAMPITLVLAVIGRYVPSMSWLHVMLAQEGAREAHTALFQRLAVHDAPGAALILERHLAAEGWVSVVDQMVLPVLRLTEQEAKAGDLDEARATFVLEHLVSILEALAPEAGAPEAGATTAVEEQGADTPARAAALPRVDVTAGEEPSPIDAAQARVLAIACGALGIARLNTGAIDAEAGHPLVRVSATCDARQASKDDTPPAGPDPAICWPRSLLSEAPAPNERAYSFGELMNVLRAPRPAATGTPLAITPAS